MDKQYFLELLHKYLNDQATEQERQFLIKFYDLFRSEPDITTLFSDAQKEALKNEINTAIWQNIENQSENINSKSIFKLWFVKAAAAVLFIGISVTGFLFLHNRPAIKPSAAIAAHKQRPDLFIVLSDGSKVILKYGSKLSYASSFAGMPKREVYLIGQAFFDIKHNSQKPFVVHTGKLQTTVLGTAFNIKALPGDKTITVTVTRGRVKVSDNRKTLGVIIPNQQITYNKENLISTQNRINASITTNWTEKDDLYFEDVTLEEAANLLENRFKVKIIFADQTIKAKRFTATFDKTENLEKELKIICEFNEASYSYDKEKTTITINSNQPINQPSKL